MRASLNWVMVWGPSPGAAEGIGVATLELAATVVDTTEEEERTSVVEVVVLVVDVV